jgi:hypothetical protein
VDEEISGSAYKLKDFCLILIMIAESLETPIMLEKEPLSPVSQPGDFILKLNGLENQKEASEKRELQLASLFKHWTQPGIIPASLVFDLRYLRELFIFKNRPLLVVFQKYKSALLRLYHDDHLFDTS